MNELLNAIRYAGISGQYCVSKIVQSETNSRGAYLLLMRLEAPVSISLRKIDAITLEAGWYVYSGSAKGPGGLRSRLQHHFRKTKKSHWHVDQLTTQCVDMAAVSVVDGHECQFISMLLNHPTFNIPCRHFGSMDCRVCESHLLQFDR